MSRNAPAVSFTLRRVPWREALARWRPALGLIVLLALVELAPPPEAQALGDAPSGTADPGVRQGQQARGAYGKLPLHFVANAGQTDARVRYYTQGSGYGVYFTKEEAVFAFVQGSPSRARQKLVRKVGLTGSTAPALEEGTTRGVALGLTFLGSNPDVTVEGRKVLAGKVNYLKGSDSARWLTGLSTFQEVAYRNLWPGIDMVFRGEGGRIKYDFIVQPGASVQAIRLAYRGADGLSLDSAGNLLIHTPMGDLTDEHPTSFQTISGKTVNIASRFVLEGDKDRPSDFGFEIQGPVDPHEPLIVDPGLYYSTFLGGSGDEEGNAIAVDKAGNVYVTGGTTSHNFPKPDPVAPGAVVDPGIVIPVPVAPGAVVDPGIVIPGPVAPGAVVDPGIVIPGPVAPGAVVDTIADAGHFVGFPSSLGPFQDDNAGGWDAFVTKLDPKGVLVYSTYLGGSSDDRGFGIAVDGAGSAYVTGVTFSKDFPTTDFAYSKSYASMWGGTAFVTKLTPDGTDLVYSTYLGALPAGPDETSVIVDTGYGIAVDGAGKAYVTGVCTAELAALAGRISAAFLTKLKPDGTGLVYTWHDGKTYGHDRKAYEGRGIVVDGAGNAYVLCRGDGDFVTKVKPDGLEEISLGGGGPTFWSIAVDGAGNVYVTGSSRLGGYWGPRRAIVKKLHCAQGKWITDYTTQFGSNWAVGNGIAVDGSGNAYVTGSSNSSLPTTPGGFQETFGGGKSDAFVTKLTPNGSIDYLTYLGGSGADVGNGIAVDGSGNAYVTGTTSSSDFPTTPQALSGKLSGGSDAFVTKLDPSPILLMPLRP